MRLIVVAIHVRRGTGVHPIVQHVSNHSNDKRDIAFAIVRGERKQTTNRSLARRQSSGGQFTEPHRTARTIIILPRERFASQRRSTETPRPVGRNPMQVDVHDPIGIGASAMRGIRAGDLIPTERWTITHRHREHTRHRGILAEAQHALWPRTGPLSSLGVTPNVLRISSLGVSATSHSYLRPSADARPSESLRCQLANVQRA